MRWTSEVWERLRGVLFRARDDAEMEEEMRFHIEMEAGRLVRERGLDAREARRRAAVAFGGVEKHKEEVRDARGLAWVPGVSLDLRLGARMLVKHPGLTVVGGLGMAVAIAVSAGFFTLFHSYYEPTLPLHEGDRVVAVWMWDAAEQGAEDRVLHDFATWREELETLEDLGAFRTVGRNLILPGGQVEPVAAAEMTASGFRTARVPPHLGRYLADEDERPGAAPVAVIGHELWRTRFESDPVVVGRAIRLGNTTHTVVGVMPEGFGFPVNHRLWIPLQAGLAEHAPRTGPEVTVFGRLAPGATADLAAAELAALTLRTAAASPETHAHLRPQVVPYTAPFSFVSGGSLLEIYLVQLLVSMLLVVVSMNVAVLVYARTAMRWGEIVVRSALGASRRRIVAQLFAEALVLSLLAAAVGLLLLRWAFGLVDGLLAEGTDGRLPFWMEGGVSFATVVFALVLAALAAVLTGVVPAVQATAKRLQPGLRAMGGGTGLQLGRTWTLLIVAQVAFAVAVLPATVFYASAWIRHAMGGHGFPAEEFLTARVEMDDEIVGGAEGAAPRHDHASRYAARLAELARRLAAEPEVSAVAFVERLPGQEAGARIEIEGVATHQATAGTDGAAAGALPRDRVRSVRVDAQFFRAFDIPVLAGRSFHSGDAGAAAAPVIVNRTFVREHLADGSTVGRRLRLHPGAGAAAGTEGGGGAEPAPWHEIVGVVGDVPSYPRQPERAESRVYHPMDLEQAYPAVLAVRLQGGGAGAFTGRLREVAAALDPALRPHEILPLDAVYRRGEQGMMRLGAAAMTLVTLSVLLLSAAGIYAMMSFTVTRRRREIGIRAALGADPRRILRGIFSRAVGQLTAGIAVGVGAAALLAPSMPDGHLGNLPAFIPLVAALMMGVGLLAALGPARRGLRLQPSEALKAE
jgi:putative ABC transport system permease protein